MNHLLDNFMKYATSDEDDEDEYFGPPGMTDAESKAKYDRLLATSRKLRGVGFYTSLAGSGLRYVAPEVAKSRARAEMSQSAKLRAHHRAHKNPNGLMVVTPGMAQTGQKAGRFGRGVSLAGALMIGAGQASAGIAHRKRINYLEHALREKNKEQEKTAAPMFGKKRYKPRTHNDHSSRLYHENDLNLYKKFSNAPDFDESAYKKSEQAIKDYYPTSSRESGKSAKNFLSSLIAVDMARRGGLHALSGNKPAAKRFGVAAGLASIYPAYRGMEGLKKRYHFSKEKNIEADKVERAKDDAAKSNHKEYLDKYNGGENGWYSTGNTLSYASKHALVNEAKKKNSRIQYNDDYSTNFVSPTGKKSKRRWENAGYLDEDDFDYNESNTDDPELLDLIKMERQAKKKKKADQEKTAGFMGRFDQWQNKKVHNVLENRIDRSDKVKPGEDFKKILPKGHESFKLKPSQFEDKKDYYRWKLWHHEYFDETSNDTFLRDEGEWNPSYLADYDDPELIDAYHAVNGRKTKLGGIALANKGLKKTAATKPSFKKIYESDSKLKDAVFGAYKKGPDKGANKFNVAYKKKQILKSWKNDVYKSDEVLDGKIQQRHKDNYDDAFVEAAARPIAIAAGTGAAIYGGKKLLDRYNKRQAEKKEQNYYV